MIELIFMACLATMPDHCRERSLLFSDITVGICTMQSQAVLADWSSRHPGWRISRWACRPHDTAQARI